MIRATLPSAQQLPATPCRLGDLGCHPRKGDGPNQAMSGTALRLAGGSA
jgi:hypothetical protein